MAEKRVKFYLVYFQNNDGKKINVDMSVFFSRLEESFINDEIKMPQLYNDKKIYLFEYTLSESKDYSEFVIPFGKKKANAPYKKNKDNLKAIVQYDEELFDVNLFYYSKEYDAAIITTDKEGPSSKAIESFLNCFLDTNKYSIRIKPILCSDGMEKVRNSRKVRSISISVNLDPSIQKYYNQHINSEVSLIKGISQLMKISKNETKNKSFKLELGMGRHRDYMDFQNAISLLNELDVADSEIIKEVKVNYYDGHSEKIETTKIKNAQIELSDRIVQEGSGSIKSSRLLETGKVLLEKHLYRINEKNRIINEESVYINDDIEICKGEKHAELQKATV